MGLNAFVLGSNIDLNQSQNPENVIAGYRVYLELLYQIPLLNNVV